MLKLQPSEQTSRRSRHTRPGSTMTVSHRTCPVALASSHICSGLERVGKIRPCATN
jgi:hypothetical protein